MRRVSVPRPRGDQPTLNKRQLGNVKRSPPTRGSTARGPWTHVHRGAFPAHAGINRLRSWQTSYRRSVPRPRGDQPSEISAMDYAKARSPPTRGSTALPYGSRSAPPAFPAHAGINRPFAILPPAAPRVPRPRGDQPLSAQANSLPHQRSPPTRGSTGLPDREQDALVAFPAHAGINRLCLDVEPNEAGVPRPRGDQPTDTLPRWSIRKRSPPTRGSTGGRTDDHKHAEAFPAHAGINRELHAIGVPRHGVPRPRGDQPDHKMTHALTTGRSPPTRGFTKPGMFILSTSIPFRSKAGAIKGVNATDIYWLLSSFREYAVNSLSVRRFVGARVHEVR